MLVRCTMDSVHGMIYMLPDDPGGGEQCGEQGRTCGLSRGADTQGGRRCDYEVRGTACS